MAKESGLNPLGCALHVNGNTAVRRMQDPEFPVDLEPRLTELDLKTENLYLAWEIVRLVAAKLAPKDQRALMLLIVALQLAMSEGSTRLLLKGSSQLKRVLAGFSEDTEEHAGIIKLMMETAKISECPDATGLSDILGRPGDYRPLIIDQQYLYMQKIHALETRVAELLQERIDSPLEEKLDSDLESAVQAVFNHPPEGVSGKLKLDSEQQAAVYTALNGRISIISGRPGSGKTSIVASILRVLARVGNPPLQAIALAAPTGRAADRMRQSVAAHLAAIGTPDEADRRLAGTDLTAATLHRLLGYSPGQDRFRYDEHNPLSEQLVIVDECSMIDLAMIDRLLRALKPGTRLVLLGDADQLPPIETGAVLRALCHSERVAKQGRVIVLKQSYRAREDDQAGRSILAAAENVNAGMIPAAVMRKDISALEFSAVEQLFFENEAQVIEFYDRWWELFNSTLPDLEERLAETYMADYSSFSEQTAAQLRVLMEHYERFRILCVTRVAAGGTGSEAVNAWFQQRWSERQPLVDKAVENAYRHIGEPVMVTHNDYKRQLFNGDSGLVLKVKAAAEPGHQAAEPMAVFRRGDSYVAYPLSLLRGSLEPAWAATVHRAQGSEYDHVAILLPAVQLRPLTRELLYTAITRARRSVLIVGSEAVLRSGVEHRLERDSGLGERLG